MRNNEKEHLTGVALKNELEAACRGLIYVSETDSRVDVVFEESYEGSSLRNFMSGFVSEASGPIVEQTPARFFDRLTTDKDWHTLQDKRTARRYQRLRKLISDNCRDVTMFRSGRVRIDIFVLGKDDEDNIAGIRTRAVET